MVAQAINPNTQEADASLSLWAQGQPSLHNESQGSQSYIVRQTLSQNSNITTNKNKQIQKLETKPNKRPMF